MFGGERDSSSRISVVRTRRPEKMGLCGPDSGIRIELFNHFRRGYQFPPRALSYLASRVEIRRKDSVQDDMKAVSPLVPCTRTPVTSNEANNDPNMDEDIDHEALERLQSSLSASTTTKDVLGPVLDVSAVASSTLLSNQGLAKVIEIIYHP
jgi:hypothetical protein